MSGEALLALAERCEKADGPDRELDTEIAVAVSGDAGAWIVRPQVGSIFSHKAGWWRDSTDHSHLAPSYTGSYDDAMSLVPRWLTPTIIGHDRKVRLLNGVGGTVGGSDYLSVAPSLQRGITAAALRARAQQEPSA